MYFLNEVHQEFDVQINAATGIGDASNHHDPIMLYPNPVTNVLNVESSYIEPAEIILYDIASRMESSGESGKINISGSTYELVKDKFTCSHRGKIEANNIGMIDIFFVIRSFSEG